MGKIHQTAIVSKHAQIDSTVSIGAYAVIEDEVKLAKNVRIWPHAYISSGTEIGEGTEIHMGAVMGHVPQDLNFKGEKSFLKIGKNNIIREYATIHRGTGENTLTEVGDENFIMGLAHIGHNCKIGNKVILANCALIAGHCVIEDGVFVSGGVLVHQFCRIGRIAIISGYSAVHKDVPPYMIVRGASVVRAVNVIGLRRSGFTSEIIQEIRNTFKILYKSNLNTSQAIEMITKLNPGKEVLHFVDFIKKSKRGICKNGHAVDTEYAEVEENREEEL